ncbi:TetR/AcrR family transcriptional regulator [Brucepastera parasyntrophica]|uniref:TetR/AcrR family transcriptional regulator n=1 Tax=Brucepastera parasyntrophica TaxID=2880008 RepID=UPI002109800A|nr:TetR/AcrR family transcriptional regulator [Brucepastera parasyntrophica]ULQ59072.1 TetR/AcrR family transcriptional regulator [Brucepastera parasyntrophica]
MDTTATISRREQIINAAFSAAHESEQWSLADIAGRIGISKTAIYRHFKNREGIEQAMNDRFFREVGDVIARQDNITISSVRTAFTDFFRSHPEYLCFFIRNLFSLPGYALLLIDYLENEFPVIAETIQVIKQLPEDERDEITIFIIKNTLSIISGSFSEWNTKTAPEELYHILRNGIASHEVPDDKRLFELETIAHIDTSELQNRNKLFNAIAATVQEHGMANASIGRIAKEMGMAKSSLYNYYSTKQKMFSELIRNEVDSLQELITPRITSVDSVFEQMYITMCVYGNYLYLKPDILPVFNWMRYNMVRQASEPHTVSQEEDDFVKPYYVNQLFPPGGEQKRKCLNS